MGLFKRGQTWWMRFTYKGKQIRKSTETDDKKLAIRIYQKVMGEVAEGKWFEKLPGEEKTFRQMMEKYLVEHSARNKASSSHIRDKSLKNHLVQHLGELTLAEINPKLISEYKTKRIEQGASPRTVNYELALMSHAFNLAIKEWEWCKDNPVSKVSREKVNNSIERWLTDEEEERLLKASRKWLQELIIFALNTGLRQSEMLSLQWPQIDLFRKTVSILEQKNEGKDILPLNKKALDVLKLRAKIRHINTNLVFFTSKGTRVSARNLLRAFYIATKKAGIESFRWHDLRHTFATRMVQERVDIYTIQRLGRWKDISMVKRYAHHSSESLRAGVEVLDKVRKKISTNLAQSNEKGATANP